MKNQFFFSFSTKLTLKFPHSSSNLMSSIINFHENCLFMIFFVLFVVLVILIFKNLKKFSFLKNTENEYFEIVWTILPTLIILCLMIPSLELLYLSESLNSQSLMKVKVIGHQWYWSYKMNKNFKEMFTFDSYMVNEKDLSLGEFRKKEVDIPLPLNIKDQCRFLITSTDVIHSWKVPEFGIKVDAIPGRLNQITCKLLEVGRFFGFCTELCGVNHSFMPIVVEVLKE